MKIYMCTNNILKMILIDGKKAAKLLREELKKEVEEFEKQNITKYQV